MNKLLRVHKLSPVLKKTEVNFEFQRQLSIGVTDVILKPHFTVDHCCRPLNYAWRIINEDPYKQVSLKYKQQLHYQN